MKSHPKIYGAILAATALMAGAVVGIATDEGRDTPPPPAPTTVVTPDDATPPPVELLSSKGDPHDHDAIVQEDKAGKVKLNKSGRMTTGLVAALESGCPHRVVSTSAVNPGNPCGYPWYSGYRWPNTKLPNGKMGQWFCIDSSIPGHPLGAVANKLRVIHPNILVSAYGKAGTCKAKGFPKNRYVTFVPFSSTDKSQRPYACGLAYAPNYGAYGLHPDNAYLRNLPLIKINVTGYKRTPCGAEPEWTDVFAHEATHLLGHSHNQPRSTSIMRQGHSLDAYDIYYAKMIAGFYPTVTRQQIP